MKTEKVKYLALTEEQRAALLAETGIVQKWLVKRPDGEWKLSGSIPFDAEPV